MLAGAIRRKQTEQVFKEQEAQLIAARRIQEHLRPQAAPDVPGIEVAGTSYAAEYTAGDYFDYLQMADGTLGIVIGDVSGHGFSTGLLMASVSLGSARCRNQRPMSARSSPGPMHRW